MRWFIKQNMALSVMLTSSEATYFSVAGHVVLKEKRETSVLVSKQAAGLVQVGPHDNKAKYHAYITYKGFMDAYLGNLFIPPSPTTARWMYPIHNTKMVGEVADAQAKTVKIKDEHFCTLWRTCQ